MQAAEAGKGDVLAGARRVNRAGFWRILGQRKMSPTVGIVAEAIGEDAAQVALA
jgi:hypothetical protein